MPRVDKDELLARRRELELQLEAEVEKLNAHRSGALVDSVVGLRTAIDAIDRRLAASDRARLENERRRVRKAAERKAVREVELAALDSWPPKVSLG